METYTFYPPQIKPTKVPYQVITQGTENCRHELGDNGWRDRISVRDGIVFISFSCKHCGRQLCQSLDEVSPPATWKGTRD